VGVSEEDVALVKRRVQALNERLRALVRTMTAVERDDPEFAQEMRHYGVTAEFAEITNGVADLDVAVAALVKRLGFD
jgi:ubiquinone biosynthesis protein UbiJ